MVTTTDLIKEYKSLFDNGALSQEEYTYLKKSVLGQQKAEFLSVAEEAAQREELEQQRKARNKERTETISCLACIVIFLVIFFMIGSFVIDTIKDAGSSDYATYYIDNNGNGKLDRGEYNYTEDENGNIVDDDTDGSNWE